MSPMASLLFPSQCCGWLCIGPNDEVSDCDNRTTTVHRWSEKILEGDLESVDERLDEE